MSFDNSLLLGTFSMRFDFFCLIADYPRGWAYLPSVRKYYRPVFELVDWNTARSRCAEFGSGAQLVAINDAAEDTAVRQLISSFEGNAASDC